MVQRRAARFVTTDYRRRHSVTLLFIQLQWQTLLQRRTHSKVTMGSGVAEWARALTGDRTVNGSSPAAVKTFRFASELWQFRLPRLASVFRMRH